MAYSRVVRAVRWKLRMFYDAVTRSQSALAFVRSHSVGAGTVAAFACTLLVGYTTDTQRRRKCEIGAMCIWLRAPQWNRHHSALHAQIPRNLYISVRNVGATVVGKLVLVIESKRSVRFALNHVWNVCCMDVKNCVRLQFVTLMCTTRMNPTAKSNCHICTHTPRPTRIVLLTNCYWSWSVVTPFGFLLDYGRTHIFEMFACTCASSANANTFNVLYIHRHENESDMMIFFQHTHEICPMNNSSYLHNNFFGIIQFGQFHTHVALQFFPFIRRMKIPFVPLVRRVRELRPL